MDTPGRSIPARRYLEDRGVWCKLTCNHVARFSNLHAHFASPIQQNAIKFLAAYLIRLRPRDLPSICEVNVSSSLTIMRQEARTPLLRKTCGLDLLGHTQSRERVVGSREQRLADMESRECVALKENNRMTTLS